MLSGCPLKLIIKLLHPGGFDAIILPGFGERMQTPESEVLFNKPECLKPLGQMKKTWPVPAGSQWAGSAPMVYEKLKTVDFGVVPGRGVSNHPMGPKAGAASLRQGWEAFKKGLTLEEHARKRPELKAAIDAFGN